MNYTDLNTLATETNVSTEIKMDNLNARKDLMLLDLQNDNFSSLTRELLINEVTKITQILNNL